MIVLKELKDLLEEYHQLSETLCGYFSACENHIIIFLSAGLLS